MCCRRWPTQRWTTGPFPTCRRGNYASDRDTETESNATAYAKYDRFLTEKWYLYANTSFENDKFKDLRLRSTLGVGTGYQFFDTPRTILSLEGGIDYVHTDFYTQPTDDYPAARTRFSCPKGACSSSGSTGMYVLVPFSAISTRAARGGGCSTVTCTSGDAT